MVGTDYTPMEFVVDVLQRIFDKDHETAARLMLYVHNYGIGECGTYPPDVAGAKAAEVLALARGQGHPLWCVLDPA
jgi:ATP-dependent Clp protease adaptor protein ClpS